MTHILFFGEPLIRISPQDFNHFSNACPSKLFYGGSEVNIARSLQGFGLNTKLVTALPDTRLGDSFIQFLYENHINCDHIQRKGERIGLYFLENAFGPRQGEVIYDRSNSSLHDFNPEQLDFSHIFKDVSLFHFSGITLSLGQSIQEIILIFLKEAKKRGITISFDLNFRSHLISPKKAKELFSQFAGFADICFGIEPLMIDSQDYDFFKREEADDEAIKNRMLSLIETFHLKAIYHTSRGQDQLGRNSYQAYLATETKDFSISKQVTSPILERVGSGDAFVAGAIYQMMAKSDPKSILDFAVANAILKCTLEGDNMFESPEQVEKILNHTNDIIR
ncbi:sugar kinase [Streptococcus catagoni]|uniref:sugar kinase n=1 Tax=Streptococcus catagoni TaxID=2654874 RepID=UPI0014076565|nr:sugar kinase [Streptococcus catagoni]